MITKKVTYTDFMGNERNEDLHFHMNRAECVEFLAEFEAFGDDFKTMVIAIKDLLLRSYGVISADGKRFIKSEENSTAFYQTEAYSIVYMELANDEKAMNDFIAGIIPADLAEKLNSK